VKIWSQNLPNIKQAHWPHNSNIWYIFSTIFKYIHKQQHVHNFPFETKNNSK
jgi:hypothetical protein